MALANFTTPWVNPATPALLNPMPYLTASEYGYEPTAIDTENLVDDPNDEIGQQQALVSVINSASSWIDSYCHQVLAATQSTEISGRPLLVKPDGCVYFPCDYKPILEIDSVGLGYSPSVLQVISSQAQAGLTVEGRVVVIPTWGWASNSVAPQFPPGGPRHRGLYVQIVYVNGYPHTRLATTCAIGDSLIVVASPSAAQGVLGIYAGTQLSIYDGDATEVVQVQSVGATNSTGTTLNLVAPVAYNHNVPTLPDGIHVSGLPPAVKRAAVFATSWLVKTRGDTTLTLADNSSGGMGSARKQNRYAGLDADLAAAMQILDDGGFVVASKMKH